MSLREYRKKRDFKKTREPQGGKSSTKAPIFVVQEHWASHLHYDFRLEAFGTLKSWAVPKGPSTKVGDKRLAVEVEDHPIAYAKFKGRIPEGEYGAGIVKIWDNGTWTPPDDLKENLKDGHLEFELKGHKLKGKWLLQRTKKAAGKKSQWLLIKRHDDEPELKKKALPPKRRAKADPWPEEIDPQLALLVDEVPKGADWIHEIKFDGYRTTAWVKRKDVRFISRNGLDWTDKYAPLDKEIKKLKLSDAILDGEMVALDENGHSSFSALQLALKSKDMSNVRYYVFDLLYLDGRDLRDEPLKVRKEFLRALLKTAKSSHILYSDHWRAQGDELFKKACEEGLEGIIAKNWNKPYLSGRSDAWRKIKCTNRQELVIGGYTDPQGERKAFGALLMGTYEDDGSLRYVGKVGTGFNDKMLGDLKKRFDKLTQDESPFDVNSPRSSKINWIKPKLVAEVEFRGWTHDGSVRQGAFLGLREDKKPGDVHREKPKHPEKKSHPSRKAISSEKNAKKTGSAFKITHPDRIVYPKAGVKKIDVANYYRSVAPWMLEHLANRPLSLVRCPNQAGGTCFFQKHVDTSKYSAISEAIERDQKVIYVDSEEGILQLIQWGVIEIHAWQSHAQKNAKPDQIVFDLDPDGAVPWKTIVKTAIRIRDLLEDLSLQSFLKTTGGKGLHIHVPIEPRYSWESVKEFSKTVCRQLESESPELYTTNILKKKRGDKIFLDYLRNGFGATAIAPYSLRSKEEPFAAVPLDWSELGKLKGPQVFDMENTLKRLAKQKKDPWMKYNTTKQRIEILER